VEGEKGVTDTPRLIEHAFPLIQTSLDSVHEKNVRHGHISTLHIWPARRPLAACRAALIATLLPDPSAEPKPDGMSDEDWHQEIIRLRRELCEKIGGKVVKTIEKKKMPSGQTVEREREITDGGILHWGREKENKELLDWFRQAIRKAHGGRSPKVLDPFAGGGAIPLEAMRLGCEATAVDINPVAWFILKCTLEYPQKLAGKTHPLPGFILEDESFMEAFYKAHPHLVGRTKKTGRQKEKEERQPGFFDKPDSGRAPKADLAWHVRAWGRWVLDHARRELARFYPTYADFEPFDRNFPKPYEKQPLQLVPIRKDGTPDSKILNADFSEEYLRDKSNPRWVVKPTVAYLWARTVACKNCRAIVPLLKTRWLCKKEKKRILILMAPNADRNGVVFGIETGVPLKGGNAAQHRENDKQIGGGTMSRSGAKCPCCGAIMTMEDIRLEGMAGQLGTVNTAIVVDGQKGKEYRLPTAYEIRTAGEAEKEIAGVFADIPFGLPEEPLPSKEALGFRVPLYGLDKWRKLFTPRQLLALGIFVKWTRNATSGIKKSGYQEWWLEPLTAYLALAIDRMENRGSVLCIWNMPAEKIEQTFARFALPILWDFAESNPLATASGNYSGEIDWISLVCSHACKATAHSPSPKIEVKSSTSFCLDGIDVIVTDPPYYDAISYSDLMDFFYIWLRRSLHRLSSKIDEVFQNPLSPKWNHETGDGELIDDSSRFAGDSAKSKQMYEDGMFRAFSACHRSLNPDGKLVVVFAHKHHDAWETLVTAIIRAGFIVDGSWPIQTERTGRMRANASAALASSVWLVCRKRPESAKPGWDNQVLEEMRRNIRERLREFWDAGIRGPDFVWAATGPALEAYSRHPVVRKANEPGPMAVSEFLTHVRRMVVDFVVGRVLSGDGTEPSGADETDAMGRDRLDEPTAYYLLHRHDFGLEEAPAGACILYAVSCGVSDKELADTWDLIGFTRGKSSEESDEEANADAEADPEAVEESGSKVKLKTWAQRKGRSLGFEAPGGKPVPLIDRVHRLMHLWKAGDLNKVDEYLDDNGLRRQELFRRLLQSLIELSSAGSEERSLLESISNHIQAKGAVKDDQVVLAFDGNGS
jgi:putative DNA methylase